MVKERVSAGRRVTKRVLMMAVGISIIALGVYLFMYIMTGKLSREVQALAEEVRGLEVRESQVGQLRKDLLLAKEKEELLATYFVDTDNVVPFFETIESYAQAVGTDIEFASATVVDSPLRFTLSLNVEGSYAGVYNFITLLESAPYEIHIDTMSMQSLSDSSATWRATIGFSVISVIRGS